MAESLDLTKLVFAHSVATLLACVSVTPVYNLPLSLFGLYAAGAAENTTAIKQFAFLLFISLVLDIIWLAAWSWQSSAFTEALVIANLLLKPITILASLSSLRQQGTSFSFPSALSSSFPGLSGQQPAWAQQSQPYQNFNDGDEEQAINRTSNGKGAPTKKAQPNLPSDNYHTLGDENE